MKNPFVTVGSIIGAITLFLLILIWNNDLVPEKWVCSIYSYKTESIVKHTITDESEYNRAVMLSEVGSLYFDGEYLFDQPPTGFSKDKYRARLMATDHSDERWSISWKIGHSLALLLIAAVLWFGISSSIEEEYAN